MLKHIIKFFIDYPLITRLVTLAIIVWGIATAPFSWDTGVIPSDPIPVDAIPDIGENQQIVYTEWPGKSPQDIEDQITYPLTTSLLGIPGVKTIRSSSIFGLSSIYIIFDEDIEFYWSRSRILEKLNALSPGILPEGVNPSLGPDATALGQIFWYTLEGRDENGRPNGGWDPQELRSIQDFYVKYSLASTEGVSEIASVGGYVSEYQVDLDPVAMKNYQVTIDQVIMAVKESNLDIGARTIEFNKAEYMVRGLGFIKSIEDLESAVIESRNQVPVRLKDVARIQMGPANRRGGLDKSGVEAVGGVVVARYGTNPMQVIQNLKDKIEEISPGLPTKTLADGSQSKVTVIPFYDRSGLIKETLGTLEEAISLEVLISIVVVIIMVLNLRTSIVISSLLPLGVFLTFILMKYTAVDANIVALSGIAIAIGVMVDVGVVITENIFSHLSKPENETINTKQKLAVVYEATIEVSSAVVTALSTTIISFIPVFALQAQEGKLFRPLAFTKSYALLAALVIGIVIIPSLAHWIYSLKSDQRKSRLIWNILLISAGIFFLFIQTWAGIVLILVAINNLFSVQWPEHLSKMPKMINLSILLGAVIGLLSNVWLPLGPSKALVTNIIFVILSVSLILGVLMAVKKYYQMILQWCLNHKTTFFAVPLVLILWGALAWQGFDKVFSLIPVLGNTIGLDIRNTGTWQKFDRIFPGIGSEFMPALDEGSFLLMPTTMPHSGVEENIETIRTLDYRVSSIPEVENTIGKWGRVNSALDPAPISMFENVVNYKPEYVLNEKGHRIRFKVNREGHFELLDGTTYDPKTNLPDLVNTNNLIPDASGNYFRQWRKEIQHPDDIWNEIVAKTQLPGLTSAPKLQPIATRLVMLSTGMRAPMGLKIYGPDLKSIENAGLQIEQSLKNVEGIAPASIFADRVVGKPFLEIIPDRNAIARHGLSISDLQNYIGVAIGGKQLTTTVEGRERYGVRVRYAREYRDDPDQLNNILIPVKGDAQIPLKELATINYVKGPQNIKGENSFLVGYVIFDKQSEYSEGQVVENASKWLKSEIERGALVLEAGVSYQFAGSFENQQRASKRLSFLIPICLILIFLILYFQFNKLSTVFMIFAGIIVAFAGGFITLWFYHQPWFLDFSLFGTNMKDLFMVKPIYLSVAVWVGFIALFGIATDDGVLMGTYLKQHFNTIKPTSVDEIHEGVIFAGSRRIRPAVMTSATTLIALLPVLSSTGKGADILVPMAIPTFGGMAIAVITMFIVPVLYSLNQEYKLKKEQNEK